MNQILKKKKNLRNIAKNGKLMRNITKMNELMQKILHRDITKNIVTLS
jgi:hypothetical protein